MLTLSECEVALVRQRYAHQFGGVALVLIGVHDSGINRTDSELMASRYTEPCSTWIMGLLVSISA